MIKKTFIFAIAAAISGAFFINFCALVFQCGCHSIWNGGAVACNIHNATGRHCPWCIHGSIPALIAIILPQLAISFWPSSWGFVTRLAAAIAAFPVFGGVAALAYGLWWGYWK
ncbi:MAG: hypothetical protein ACRD8O_04330 [Bryobacteraceae bacterium]